MVIKGHFVSACVDELKTVFTKLRYTKVGLLIAIKWLRDMMDFDKVINEMDYQQVVHNLLTDKPDVSL